MKKKRQIAEPALFLGSTEEELDNPVTKDTPDARTNGPRRKGERRTTCRFLRAPVYGQGYQD